MPWSFSDSFEPRLAGAPTVLVKLCLVPSQDLPRIDRCNHGFLNVVSRRRVMSHNICPDDSNTIPFSLSSGLHLFCRCIHVPRTQSPAIAVEFMEVSGELLVSSSSGLCSIPSCRWCPSSLLVANERADRRAAAARTSSGSSSGSDGIPHQVPSATPTSGEGFASMTTQADGTTAGERGIRVHENASVAPHALTLDRRPPRAGEGCNSAGDRKINREEAQALAGNINGENERTCATRNIEEEPSRATDHREGTPPVGAGVGDEPEVPAPCRLTSYLTPRKASGSHDWREFSILDRMNAKFSSMPTSPPPPTMPTTKVRHRQAHFKSKFRVCSVPINN